MARIVLEESGVGPTKLKQNFADLNAMTAELYATDNKTSLTATTAIPAYGLVQIDGSGNIEDGEANSVNIVGANQSASQVDAAGAIDLVKGYVTLDSAVAIDAGKKIKAAHDGLATMFVDTALAGSTIDTGAGGNAGNQPANDGVEVVSAEAADTTQEVTIIGTTNGGVTVVTETVTLNGTTPVATTKTDWGVILAVKLSAAATGDVTVREASGDQTITTVTAGQTSAGVTAVPAADQPGYGVAPTAVNSAAGTKYVGIAYTQIDGATAAYQAVQLNGTTAVTFATEAHLVTEVYTLDVATGHTVTFAVGAEDDEEVLIGVALTAATAGATFTASLSV